MVETGGWGGIAHYAWNLCAALAGAGVEVSLLTNREWELRHLPCRFEVDRGFAGDVGYFRNVKALRDQLARSQPDVVHVQSLLSTRLDALVVRVEKGEGTAGRFVQDPALYENFNAAAKELRGLLGDVRKDPRKYLRVRLSVF